MDKTHLEQGTIVYWLTPYYKIEFGVVEETWHDGVDINLLCPPNKTLINGEPIHNISFPTTYRKLPKGWSYDMKLFESSSEWTKEDNDFFIPLFNNPTNNNIELLIDKGWLVKRKDEWLRGHVDVQIEKGEFRLVFKHRNEPQGAFKSFKDLYLTYDEALQTKEELFAEFQRVANLSDYEYNLEKLDQVAGIWAKLYSIPEDRLEKEKDMIKSLKNFDNLEFRIANEQLQFKEWNKKRWTGISYE